MSSMSGMNGLHNLNGLHGLHSVNRLNRLPTGMITTSNDFIAMGGPNQSFDYDSVMGIKKIAFYIMV